MHFVQFGNLSLSQYKLDSIVFRKEKRACFIMQHPFDGVSSISWHPKPLASSCR